MVSSSSRDVYKRQAQKWACVDRELWLRAADEAMDKEFDGDYEIWGGDLDPAAVDLARRNAELAEVDDIVKFEVADARTFHWGGMYGRIVTNPPYGCLLYTSRCV